MVSPLRHPLHGLEVDIGHSANVLAPFIPRSREIPDVLLVGLKEKRRDTRSVLVQIRDGAIAAVDQSAQRRQLPFGVWGKSVTLGDEPVQLDKLGPHGGIASAANGGGQIQVGANLHLGPPFGAKLGGDLVYALMQVDGRDEALNVIEIRIPAAEIKSEFGENGIIMGAVHIGGRHGRQMHLDESAAALQCIGSQRVFYLVGQGVFPAGRRKREARTE